MQLSFCLGAAWVGESRAAKSREGLEGDGSLGGKSGGNGAQGWVGTGKSFRVFFEALCISGPSGWF